MSPIASYRRLLSLAGAGYVIVAFLGRLPLAMSQLGTLLLVSDATGRYTAGGASNNGDRVVDTVDCGSGYDVVLYEKGIDKINTNCEKKNPY